MARDTAEKIVQEISLYLQNESYTINLFRDSLVFVFGKDHFIYDVLFIFFILMTILILSYSELIQEGIQITLVGTTNVGKSSLMNILCDREISIVSEVPGTTRDVITAKLDIEGIPVNFYDVAGLRIFNESEIFGQTDQIEQEGIKRAIKRALMSDMMLLILAQGRVNENLKMLKDAFSNYYRNHKSSDTFDPESGDVSSDFRLRRILVIINKIDLSTSIESSETRVEEEDSRVKDCLEHSLPLEFMPMISNLEKFCKISCKTSDGIENLLQLIKVEAKRMIFQMPADINTLNDSSKEHVLSDVSSRMLHTSKFTIIGRHRQHLKACRNFLLDFIGKPDCSLEEMCEEIRSAIREFSFIIGEIGNEDILNAIFKKFCIGK